MATKAEFLSSVTIFQDLDEDELEDLARIATEYEFKDGAVIAYQRDLANSLYIVRSGRLFAYQVDDRGIVRDTRPYLPGDYFDDAWLFVPDIHPATVKATGTGRVLVISEPDFLKFLETHKGALDKLYLLEKAEEAALRSRLTLPRRRYAAIDLLPDELIEYETRRSKWLLLFRVTWPLAGMFLFAALFYLLLLSQANDAAGIWLWVVPMIPVAVFGLVLLIQVIDWANDYFIITTKHIAHYEFELPSFRVTLHKTPLDRIQSVEVVKPNLLANILGVGNVRVTTAAQEAVIYFDDVDDPETIRNTLNELRERVRALDFGRIQATMRDSVEGHFQAQRSLSKVEESTEDFAPVYTANDWLKQLLSFWSSLTRFFRFRVEEGNVITYRRHYLVLLRWTWWLLGLALFLMAVMFVAPVFEMFLLGLLLLLVVALALIWRIEDWRNDIYQVTDRYVIDIDRQPFGFGESRKQAELGNVQNVKAKRAGLIETIFNYGYVHVETAGAQADIVFENVANPNRVQSDIFKRREQFQQRERALEGERRRQEYAVLLDVYQQATEQGRLPRRTPPPV